MESSIPNKSIFIDQLREMFSSIAENTDWNINKPLLWGHFFTHSEPTKLESVIPKLENMGLSFVDLYESDKDDENEPDMFWLHMEEVRVHTPDSLDKKNDELYLFASEEGLDSYDGMDVGPVKK